MSYDFLLPDLGEGITEGEIVKWLIKEGDDIEEHQILLEIETDKAIVEVPSPKKGTVTKIHCLAGDIAKVGHPLTTISLTGDSSNEKSVSVVGKLPEPEEVLATPAVRSLAKRLKINLADIEGTGHAGRITETDLRKVDVTRETASKGRFGPIETIPIKGVRRSIAKNLVRSHKTTAAVTSMSEVDVTELCRLREGERRNAEDNGVHLTFIPFFIKAALHALQKNPLLNASVNEDREEITLKNYFDFGIAVDTPDGLMVPVVRGVDKKTILELAIELHDLSLRAKERKIKLEELKGSSFSITNYGSFGGSFGTPIINYPDVAILGTGRIADRPWVVNGKMVIRKILPLSLTFDHRVIDGSHAASFLGSLSGYLEYPASIFIESS